MSHLLAKLLISKELSTRKAIYLQIFSMKKGQKKHESILKAYTVKP